ncbi:MAG: hypothetical protein HY246_23705 [Proteobacteria bacterium]|nr:hypothetical protein [Pseudomonadota bacterium]
MVDEIIGRPPKLPAELALLAAALAAIHSVPVPAPSERPPLRDPADAFAATLTALEGDVPFLAGARLAGAALPQIEEELSWARQYIAANTAGPLRMGCNLVVTDAHPGNFLISGDRHAVFLDLEKMLYGAPAIDLAHATSLPALLWDADVAVRLSRDDVRGFYRAYFVHRGDWAKDGMLPWLLPARRLTWLRTTLAFARFRAQDAIARLAPRAASQAHRAIDTALDPLTISEIRQDWLGPEPFTF